MKRFTIVLVLFLGLLGGAVYSLKKKDNFQTEEVGKAERLVFPELSVEEITKIAISNKYGTLSVRKDGEDWVIVEREDYPANPSWVYEIVNALANLSLIQEVSVSESQLGKLDLLDPTEASGAGVGQRIDIFGENGYRDHLVVGAIQSAQSEKSMMFGEDYDGRCFVKMSNEQVSLVDQSMSFINTVPYSWMMNTIVIPRRHKRIAYVEGGEVLWRAEREDEDVPYTLFRKMEMTGEALGSLSSTMDYTFSSLSIRDVKAREFDEASVGISGGNYFELEAFDGFVQRIHLGGQTKPSEQELAMASADRGIFRKTQIKAQRYVQLEFLNQRNDPPAQEAPFTDLTYLVICPRLGDFMINFEEMLVFQKFTATRGETQ